MVAEIYSPPRVTKAALLLLDYNMVPGFAHNLATCDDEENPRYFDEAKQRAKAWKKVIDEEPALVVGSPMCTVYSAWQNINNLKRDPDVVARERARVRAGVNLALICQMYLYQIKNGRYFLHEHPAGASSWSESCIRQVYASEGVDKFVGDQCQYGALTEMGQPITTPTGFMSNSPAIRQELRQRRQGRHGWCNRRTTRQGHAGCSGRVARLAAIYPLTLCRAILGGMMKQLRFDGVMQAGTVGMQVVEHAPADVPILSIDSRVGNKFVYKKLSP